MKRVRRHAHLVAVTLIALLSCACGLAATPATTESPSHLSKSTVIALAQKKAMDVVGTLQHYNAPSIEYHADTHEWQVSYAGKSGGMDNCFLIFVNDKTKKVVFLACG
ncbi:MAG TPA: hypothetical protein VJ843_05260 [Candidatus Saccharimonadales bacterium]|nr:hypothetical protein [Candidatus Saccharimonadales bacterium]